MLAPEILCYAGNCLCKGGVKYWLEGLQAGKFPALQTIFVSLRGFDLKLDIAT